MPLDMVSVSRETEDKLHLYHDLLLKWQASINLISPNTVKDAWNRHFVDTLQLLPLVTESVKTLYDLGSGAGFPGLVLAISRPDIAVTLVESDAKKCAFLQTVSRETGAMITIKNARIEVAAKDLPAPDLVTARALSSLESLLKYIRPWLQKRSDLTAIFPKGEGAKAEIQAAKDAGWSFDLAEKPSETDRAARILCLTSIHKA